MLEKNKILICTAKQFFRGYPFEVIKVSGREYAQKLHYHDYVQIWYVKQGECTHYLYDSSYHIKEGDIFVIPPDVPHRIVSEGTGNIELIGCGFLEEFIGKDSEYLEPFTINKNDVKPFFNLNGVSKKKIEDIFDEIIFEYQCKENYFELYIRANILRMLSLLSREYKRNPLIDDNKNQKLKSIINEVISYMKEHCCEKIYIDDMCSRANLSTSYFSYIFKQFTGRTFSEYLRFLKIEKAKDMLLNNEDNKSIGEIATELGFDDLGYFDRVFKNEVGISPKKFKNLYKFF